MARHPEIRMFNITYGRDSDITSCVYCNTRFHFTSPPTPCDGLNCQAEGSLPVDIPSLSKEHQRSLGHTEPVPAGLILVKANPDVPDISTWQQGAIVTVAEMRSGTLLANGQGLGYEQRVCIHKFWCLATMFVRNNNGKAQIIVVGKKGKPSTKKKLARLQYQSTSTIDSLGFELGELAKARQELLELPSTPLVKEQLALVTALVEQARSLATQDSVGYNLIEEQCQLADLLARAIGVRLAALGELLAIEANTRKVEQQNLYAIALEQSSSLM